MLKWDIFNASLLLNEHGHLPFLFSVDKVWTKIYLQLYFRGITLITSIGLHQSLPAWPFATNVLEDLLSQSFLLVFEISMGRNWYITSQFYSIRLSHPKGTVVKCNNVMYCDYTYLYHAIENTANQNTGKLLYICQYYTQPSRHAPRICHSDCIFSMVWYIIVMQRSLMVYHGISHLSFVFSWYTHSPKDLFVYRENTNDSWDVHNFVERARRAAVLVV